MSKTFNSLNGAAHHGSSSSIEYFLISKDDLSAHMVYLLTGRESDIRTQQWLSYGAYIQDRLSKCQEGVVIMTLGEDIMISGTTIVSNEQFGDQLVFLDHATKKLSSISRDQLTPINGSNSSHSIPRSAVGFAGITEHYLVYTIVLGDMPHKMEPIVMPAIPAPVKVEVARRELPPATPSDALVKNPGYVSARANAYRLN